MNMLMKQLIVLIMALIAISGTNGYAQNKVRILIQGDTQKIVDQSPVTYRTTMENVLTDEVTKSADFILQMGDITEDGKVSNWERAGDAWQILDGHIPYVLNVGNNDLMNDGDNKFNEYFPLNRYNVWPSFVSNYDRHSNVAHVFSAGGVDWLVISMRFQRSTAVQNWAENLIATNPDKKVILIRHDANADGADVQMCKKYENVVFVMCGHTEARHQLLTNDFGNPLGWVKTCFHNKNSDHFFNVLDIDTETGVVSFRYYSPLEQRYGDAVYEPWSNPWSWDGFIFKSEAKANDARFVSQTPLGTLLPGETKQVTVTMKNSGTDAWSADEGYRLVSRAPDGNSLWGMSEVALDPNETIAPDSEKQFSFTIQAPSTEGTYTFQWKMYKQTEAFGSSTFSQTVYVNTPGEFLDDCDALTGWSPAGQLSLNTSDKQQGVAALQFSGSGTDQFNKVFNIPYNSMGTEAGTELRFWYYVSDPSQLLADNQVEITSSGRPDANEYAWTLSNLKPGWNYITLKTSNAQKIGTPDLAAINYMRIYQFKRGPVTMRLDAVQLIGENSQPSFIASVSLQSVHLTISPNPYHQGALNLHLENLHESCEGLIQIVSLQGRSVYTTQKELINGCTSLTNLPQIPTGMYILYVMTDKYVGQSKFMIN